MLALCGMTQVCQNLSEVITARIKNSSTLTNKCGYAALLIVIFAWERNRIANVTRRNYQPESE